MICPSCNRETTVFSSRPAFDGSIRRRRRCTSGHRFTTIERALSAGEEDRVTSGHGRKFEPRYVLGQSVKKPAGYRFDGWVVSVFTSLRGALRYVVDNGDGLLHIFNEGQLAPRRSGREGREGREGRSPSLDVASSREGGEAPQDVDAFREVSAW